jgi:hypothetical protein
MPACNLFWGPAGIAHASEQAHPGERPFQINGKETVLNL